MQRVILHCDMNNFYASVECMLNPELKNKPVAVSGSVEERHGIVLAKNYAAKAFGVSTGEAIWQAKQKCQDLVIVEPHYEQYMKFSKLAREIYGRYTDQIEPYGMDECWLDVTGSGCMGTGFEIADEIRRTVKFELGLTISAGVSFNKIFAKLGSDTADDIRLALVPVSKKSASVYKSVNILYKSIFAAAKESKVIQDNPTIYLSGKNGGVPQKEKNPLTDDQVERLLDAIRGLPSYVFVMLGLYAGLRREEILALQWDSVFLDEAAPYLTVCRAWHTEHNRPVIMSELKTKAAHRDVPLPDCLAKCLREAKETSTSAYVVANSEGEPLSYTQFKRLWQYIVTRTVKERSYYRYENGKRVKHTVKPVLGERAAHNGKVVYSLDFEVTPHLLRHTYITNLIHASVDPKTVQYLAGHENSKITMDIYAKAKYNRPDELAGILEDTFTLWDAE